MSQSPNWREPEESVEDWLNEKRRQSREQHAVWATIEEERMQAILDREPTLWKGSEFVNAELPVLPYIVEPFFPSGGLVLLHGKRGIGKSMLTMNLARSVATGEPFLGQFPSRQGNVVVIQLDMVDFVFQERLQQAADFYSFDNWYTLVGYADLMRASTATKWVKEINSVEPELIIIDTLRKAHRMPENSSDTPAAFYNKLRDLFGLAAVVLVHHDRKSQPDAVGIDHSESFRGSGAWIDDVDAGIHLQKKGRIIEMSFSKVRTCGEIKPIPLEVNPDTLVLEPAVRDGGRGPVSTGVGSVSKRDRMRAQARAYIVRSAEPSKQGIYEFLLDRGYEKSEASRVADELSAELQN